MRNKKQFPKTLRDVTLEDYMFIQNAVETYGKEEDKLYLTLVKYFNDGKDMPVVESKKAISRLNSLLSTKPEHVLRFTHKGVDYGFIPNLDKISTGELIDLESHKNSISSMHRVMAILYRPVTKKGGGIFVSRDKYEIEPYNGTEATSHIMKEIPVEIYLGAMVFFYLLGESLLEIIHTSTQNQSLNKTNSPL